MALNHHEFIAVSMLSLSSNNLFSLVFNFLRNVYDILPTFYFVSLNKTTFHVSSYVTSVIDSIKPSLIFYFYVFLPLPFPPRYSVQGL